MASRSPNANRPNRDRGHTPTAAPDLAEQLDAAIKGNYDGFAARLREVEYRWEEDDLTVDGTFLYLPLGADGVPTVPELAAYLYWRVVPFCIPKAERDRADVAYARTQDYRHMVELFDKAKGLFARARQSHKTSGEPGELLLFVLLEAVLRAPQIACKMYLKTNTEVHVHGTDSIHALVGEGETNLRLVWGESKTYQGLSAALAKACSSIRTFVSGSTTDGRPPRERDIDVVKDHLNVTDPALREALIAHLDPYSERSNEREEMFAVLVIYNAALHTGLSATTAEGRDEEFREKYSGAIREACREFGERLRADGLAGFRVHFFLVPVPSVAAFRQEFFRKLGLVVVGIDEEGDDGERSDALARETAGDRGGERGEELGTGTREQPLADHEQRDGTLGHEAAGGGA